MSKYIIDIDDNDIQKIVALGVTNCGAVYTRKYDIDDDIEELTIDYIKENCKSLLNAEYQRGFEEGKAANDKGCEGCKYQANKELTCPCSECANNYKNQWTAKSPVDDGFVRGDVVVDENGIKGIVVSSDNDEDYYFYVLYDGCQAPQKVTQRYYKKTGEHYDIDKYLKEINRSKTDDIY